MTIQINSIKTNKTQPASPSSWGAEKLAPDVRLGGAWKALHVTSDNIVVEIEFTPDESSEAVDK